MMNEQPTPLSAEELAEVQCSPMPIDRHLWIQTLEARLLATIGAKDKALAEVQARVKELQEKNQHASDTIDADWERIQALKDRAEKAEAERDDIAGRVLYCERFHSEAGAGMDQLREVRDRYKAELDAALEQVERLRQRVLKVERERDDLFQSCLDHDHSHPELLKVLRAEVEALRAVAAARDEAWRRINEAKVGIPPAVWNSIAPLFDNMRSEEGR